jgi:hypothetical protein
LLLRNPLLLYRCVTQQPLLFPLDAKRCLCASRDYAEFASFLFALIQKIPVGFKRVTVITFNYDIGAEVGFERLEQRDLPYGYFLNEKSVVGNGVKLLKLHGSINWGQDLNSKEPTLHGFFQMSLLFRYSALAHAGRRGSYPLNQMDGSGWPCLSTLFSGRLLALPVLDLGFTHSSYNNRPMQC